MQWKLRRRTRTSRGEIAFDCFGNGPPVVLVHGTPSRSYIWRRIAPVLAERHRVFLFDLLGFGESERHIEQDVSIRAHAEVLAELIDQWGVVEPAVAGHDIGGAVVLRTHLLGEVAMSRLALIDAVALRPWITARTREMQASLDRYGPLPDDRLEQEIAKHLRSATYQELERATFEALFSQWAGAEGQALYLRNIAKLDERDTAEFEPLLSTMTTPARVIWGQQDRWLDPSISAELVALMPHADLVQVPNAGHFCMEDDPARVTAAMTTFLAA